jgi:hypothetical protein
MLFPWMNVWGRSRRGFFPPCLLITLTHCHIHLTSRDALALFMSLTPNPPSFLDLVTRFQFAKGIGLLFGWFLLCPFGGKYKACKHLIKKPHSMESNALLRSAKQRHLKFMRCSCCNYLLCIVEFYLPEF